LDQVGRYTNSERFQSLASELISSKIQIKWREEADKAICNFTALTASAYRPSTRKMTLSDLNNDLWQVTWDPACKMALNSVAKTTRRMTHRKALGGWETKVGNCEVTPQALWPIVKSFMKRDGPNKPTIIHGLLGITYHLNEKANVILVCFKNEFTSHDLCDENHE
jgi:hypothetical protein